MVRARPIIAAVIAVGLVLALVGVQKVRTGDRADRSDVASANRPSERAERAEPARMDGADALVRRARTELREFTRWCESHDVACYIGEVGWPADEEDAEQWNGLAEAWYDDADRANLWVTAWATGEMWPEGYRLDIYPEEGREPGGRGPNPQAAVVEAHASTSSYLRGVNVNGGEFGRLPSRDATSAFSNANLGRYGTDYRYESQSGFDYLAGRGVRLVRLPFRWERLQPTLAGPLDAEELTRLRDAVARAGSAGLSVIIEPHNYGAYYVFDGKRGVRHAVGSAPVTSAAFADLWSRISREFAADPAVVGYGLMNEPVGQPGGRVEDQARLWERISQAAVDAVRSTGDAKLVLVPGYNYSGVARWTTYHPSAWIRDPAGAVRYEAHQYFDHDRSGAYEHRYEDEVAKARSDGF